MDDDFPLLGGPPAVELANSWYEDGAEVLDFLADAPRARRFAELVGGAPVDDVARLRELRDAVRALIAAHCDGLPLDPRAVAVVNEHAQAGSAHVELRVGEGGGASAAVHYRGRGRVRALLAASCVEVLTGPLPLRRCEGPGCPLFFQQDHGRRRFCHDGCSHRARQLRYRGRVH